MIRSDVRLAWRAARRQPGFTLVVTATLAIGIGAATALFALLQAALLKPLPYEDPGRLVLGRRTVGQRVLMWSSAPDYYDYRDQTGAFERLARVGALARKVTVSGGDRPERISATLVSDNWFPTLGVMPVAGRSFTADEGTAGAPYVVMISERLARRRYGDVTSAVGRTLTVAGLAPQKVPATIVGIVPDAYKFVDAVDLWGVLRRGENDGPPTRRFHNWVLVGRLKKEVSLAAAQQQVDVVSSRLQQLYPATNRTKGMRLDPLQAGIVDAQRPRLMLLGAAVLLVLLIACVNVAGLLLARGAARGQELAVRTALGASRGRLATQALVESLLLAIVGGAAGIALARWLVRLLPLATGLSARGISTPALDWTVLAFALGLSLLTGVMAGAAPALRMAGRHPASDLAPGSRIAGAKAGTTLRSWLVATQVTVSLLLLVVAGLLGRSLANLARVDLGFDSHQVLIAELFVPYADPQRRIQFFTGVRDDLARLPGVTEVSATSHVPVRDPAGDPPVWAEGRPPADSTQERTAALRVVLPGYLRALRIPLAAGRDLDERDTLATRRVLVINRRMARTLFPGEDPIGRRVIMPGQHSTPMAFEVVGVAGDARIYGVGIDPPMTMYASLGQMPPPFSNLVVRSEIEPQQILEALRKAVESRDRDVAVEGIGRMDETIGNSLAAERITTATLAIFSGVALLLAALGLYGVLAYHVTRSTHEIGVRMALGASARTILTRVLARSALMVVPGLAIGLGAALLGTRLLGRLLYGVPPHDPVALGAAVLTLALVALAATALPAWRAARVNPVEALRGE